MDKNKPSQSIPDELNTHLEIFGKESWEMSYDLVWVLPILQFKNRRIRLLCLRWMFGIVAIKCRISCCRVIEVHKCD